jgi:VWFA-related protein
VVSVNADLVQADVIVLDRQGRFVDNLTRDDFVLGVDGRPQAFAFFERITVGSIDEEAQLELARGGGGKTGAAVRPLDRGRSVFFFVDDFHLTPTSTQQVRAQLRRFIEHDLGQNDQMAIYSATGQIGFLQQLTGERAVLHAAVERIKPGPAVSDYQLPPMSVYQALAIKQGDRDLLDYFAAQIAKRETADQRPSQTNSPIDQARPQVLARANTLLQQAADATSKTLFSLESLIKPAAALPGRKLVFFLSDGFYLDQTGNSALGQLRRVANAAARAGVVIYALDTSGISPDPLGPDANQTADPTGRLLRASLGATTAAQDPLNALSADTGGRAFLNSNELSVGVADALQETARYYLLVWQPAEAEARARDFGRITVSVKGHPEYKVLVRRGYFRLDTDALPRVLAARHRPQPDAAPTPTRATAPELISAIVAPYPASALPMALSLSYQDVPSIGSVVTASILVDGAELSFDATPGQPAAVVEVAGVVFNTTGQQVASFKNQLNLSAGAGGQRPEGWRGIVSQYNVQLTPGLYQVRGAARDVRAGRLGSAMQWIEIPDLAARRLALASLQLSERVAVKTAQAETRQVLRPSIDARFAARSALRFHTYVYNAARDGRGQPDVVLQVQIFRDNQPVVTAPVRALQTRGATDPARLPYEAELPLDTLTTGRYQLRVTAVDRLAKTTATQRINFEVRQED